MTDIKSIQSRNSIHQIQSKNTQKKSFFRPRSSSYYKTNRKNTLDQNLNSLNLLQQQTTIKGYKKLDKKPDTFYNSGLQVAKDENNYSHRDAYNDDQNIANRTISMNKWIKQSVNGKATLQAKNENQQKQDQNKISININKDEIFVDRKTKEYRNRQKYLIQKRRQSRVRKKQQAKQKKPLNLMNNFQHPHINEPQTIKNAKQTQKLKIIQKLSNSIRNRSIQSANKSVKSRKSFSERSNSIRNSRSYMRSTISGEKPNIDDEFLNQQQIPAQEKLNYILDMINDSKLNNILWNDPTVQKILQELKIYNQKELDQYLQNNTQYFQSVFRSSPFGNFNLHYVRPSITSYNSQFQYQKNNAQSFNDIPQIRMEDYECLAKLHLDKGRLKKRITNYEAQYYKKKSETKQVIPPDSFKLGPENLIVDKTTNQMELPNRLDYDPNRIFKRLQEKNVVIGAEFAGKTQYQNTYKLNQGPPQTQFSLQLVKQRNKTKKSLYTKNTPMFETAYQKDYQDRKAKYIPPPFKYHTQLQKAHYEELPKQAYQTTKKIDSDMIIQKQQEMLKNMRKYIVPWKHKILTKLKALLQYKNFLNQRKK